MASGGDLLCFMCDVNPREQDDVVCKSCKEESRFCFECGQRERNHPFKLCKQCYSEQQKRNRTKVPVLARSTPPQPSVELTCMLPGCTKPRFTEESGRVYDFCSKSHAREYQTQDRGILIQSYF